MGRYEPRLALSLSEPFNRMTKLAVFHYTGKTPSSTHCRNNLHNHSGIAFQRLLAILPVNPSNPGAFPGFSDQMADSTSSSVNVILVRPTLLTTRSTTVGKNLPRSASTDSLHPSVYIGAPVSVAPTFYPISLLLFLPLHSLYTAPQGFSLPSTRTNSRNGFA